MAFSGSDNNPFKPQDPFSSIFSTMTHMYPINRLKPLLKIMPPTGDTHMDRMRSLKAGMLTDFTIKCHGVEYPTHKVILAVHSGYFYRMFSSEMRENNCGEINIEEPTVQPAYLELLLEYMYVGMIDVSKNCKDILAVSEFLDMEEVSEICCATLLKLATHDQFLETWDVLSLYKKSSTELKLIEFLASQFNRVQWTKEFLLLSYDRLMTLLKNSNSNANSDWMSLFRGILRWVRSDIEQRRQNLINLKEFVNLNSLPLPFLITILEDKSLMKEMPQLSVEIMTTLINNRLWLKKKIIVLCSIQHSSQSVVIECYDCQRQKVASHILKVADEISAINKRTACGFVTQLFFVTANHIYSYSLDTQDWLPLHYVTKLAADPKAQCVVCHSSIYLVSDTQVEQFELPESYEGWRKQPSLVYQPVSPVLVNVDETLYVVSADLFLQYLNVRENKWIAVDRRSTFENNEEFILSGFAAVTSQGKNMYLLKESNSTLYKIDTTNHDVYYCILPADNAPSFIRCMEVTEEDNKLKVMIIVKDGLWVEYEGKIAWHKCVIDGPSIVLRRSPGSITNARWISKIASGENQSVLFQNQDSVDFAIVTTMHID